MGGLHLPQGLLVAEWQHNVQIMSGLCQSHSVGGMKNRERDIQEVLLKSVTCVAYTLTLDVPISYTRTEIVTSSIGSGA